MIFLSFKNTIAAVMSTLILLVTSVSCFLEVCVTPNNETAKCIELRLCPILAEALASAKAASIEFVRSSTCGFEGKEPLVCCGNYTSVVKPQQSFGKLFRMSKICGKQHSDDYFHSSNDTIINEFPWVATLGYNERVGSGSPFLCSGSLISRRYVLTSAHCVNIPHHTLSYVRLGEYHLSNDTDCVEDQEIYECSNPVEDIGIENVTAHPNFNRAKKNYDVALIRLNRTVSFSDYIRPICLPLPGTLTAGVGEVLLTSGWGVIYNNGTQNDIKIKIYNKWETNDDCEDVYAKVRYPLNITEDRFCTSYLENTTNIICKGDGGGPVMISRRNRWHQEGIVSIGPRQCLLSYPLVHTKVAYFLNWIEENLLE